MGLANFPSIDENLFCFSLWCIQRQSSKLVKKKVNQSLKISSVMSPSTQALFISRPWTGSIMGTECCFMIHVTLSCSGAFLVRPHWQIFSSSLEKNISEWHSSILFEETLQTSKKRSPSKFDSWHSAYWKLDLDPFPVLAAKKIINLHADWICAVKYNSPWLRSIFAVVFSPWQCSLYQMQTTTETGNDESQFKMTGRYLNFLFLFLWRIAP